MLYNNYQEDHKVGVSEGLVTKFGFWHKSGKLFP